MVDKSEAFYGADGEIRTLEELMTLTRFPIVRARPTTRHLHSAQEIKDLINFSLIIISTSMENVKKYFPEKH